MPGPWVRHSTYAYRDGKCFRRAEVAYEIGTHRELTRGPPQSERRCEANIEVFRLQEEYG